MSDTDAGNAHLGPERLGRSTAALGRLAASPAGYLTTQRTSSLGLHLQWMNPYR